MVEWRTDKLGSVIQIKYGKAHSTLSDGEIPCYGSGGLMRYVDKYIYDNASILIPRKGTLNNIMFQNDKFWTVDTMFWSIIDTDKVDPKFLYYQLTLIDYNHLNVGSAVPSLTIPILNDIDITLPPLATQKAIAEVLSSLDDKIDLLHRQNKTLEQMAETLFRQWFVEDAGENWEEVSLGNYIKTFNGVSYKSSELNPSDTAMLTLKNFARDGSLRLDGFKEYTGKYKNQHIVREGDLVVAHTDITQDAALIGNPVLVIDLKVYKTLINSMDLVKVESMFEYLSNEFLYYLMRTRLFKEHCIGCANGSTVLHLSKDAVPSFKFNMPPKDLIISFTSIVQPMMQKLNQNINHIRNLDDIRNTLLPKLMSGEVKIS